MFQTQPLQNSGILREGGMELKQARKQYGAKSEEAKAAAKKFRMAVTSQLAASFTFTAMTLLSGMILHKMNPWRDDDEDVTPESIGENFLVKYGENFLGAVFPLIGNIGTSVAEGLIGGSSYDIVSDPTVDKINTTFDKFKRLTSNNVKWEDYVNLGTEIASYFGVPAGNAWNILWGGIQNTIDVVNGDAFTWEYGTERSVTQNIDRAYKAYVEGDKGKFDDILDQIIEDKLDDGKDMDEARSALKSSLTRYFKPLYIAAYDSKDEATKRRIRDAMTASDYYDDVVKTVQTWLKNEAKKRKK